jgi:ABC-type sugar transport system substrate-binding protein
MRYLKILLLLILVFAGCKNRSDSAKQKKIAIIVSTLNNPWVVFLAQI